MTEGWKERLEQEHEELEKKLVKLNDYIDGLAKGPVPEGMGPFDIALLMTQHYVMMNYAEILEQRILVARRMGPSTEES